MQQIFSVKNSNALSHMVGPNHCEKILFLRWIFYISLHEICKLLPYVAHMI